MHQALLQDRGGRMCGIHWHWDQKTACADECSVFPFNKFKIALLVGGWDGNKIHLSYCTIKIELATALTSASLPLLTFWLSFFVQGSKYVLFSVYLFSLTQVFVVPLSKFPHLVWWSLPEHNSKCDTFYSKTTQYMYMYKHSNTMLEYHTATLAYLVICWIITRQLRCIVQRI